MGNDNVIFRLPENVKKDMRAYRQGVGKFLEGQTRPVAFQAYRVPLGIYEQREAGKFMVRVRVAGAAVLPQQLQRLAEMSRRYGNGVLHVTTRQDIQIHRVDIDKTPDVLEGLLEVELSPRGGGGNTVRNITCCPRAGVCPNETFDVRPYAVGMAEYLLSFASSYNLPRKFKVSFSGCGDDCALACVADVGLFATVKDGAKGFCVYAGGGMGSNSRVAIKLEDFIEAGDVFRVVEAMKRLFDKHGDRSNKNRARLRYVLNRMGDSEFIKLYKDIRAQVDQEDLSEPAIRQIASESKGRGSQKPESPEALPDGYQSWRQRNVRPEKTDGQFTVKLRLELGDVPADDLDKIAELTRQVGEGLVRTTQEQDLLLGRVQEDDLPFVYERLKGLAADVVSAAGPKMVACAGAATCRLGLCRSRGLARAIAKELDKTDWPADFTQSAVRISGCPNSCGQHPIATIGLQGLARRVDGKLVPCYAVFSGGLTGRQKPGLAQRRGVVPAKSVPELIAQVLDLVNDQRSGSEDIESVVSRCPEQIAKLVQRRSTIPSLEDCPQVYQDFDSAEDFSLAGRGPGECGVGVMDVVRVDIDQASHDLDQAKKAASAKDKSEAIYAGIVAAARALLIIRGLEPKKDREIFAAFSKEFVEDRWVAQQAQQLLNQAIDYRMGDVESIDHLQEAAGQMLSRVQELFGSLDAKLEFTIQRVPDESAPQQQPQAADQQIDLRGVACPMNFVRAKLALEKVSVGQDLHVLLDEGEPARNVPASFAEQGQEVLEVRQDNDHYVVKVRRVR